jgi:hypothetical protein
VQRPQDVLAQIWIREANTLDSVLFFLLH